MRIRKAQKKDRKEIEGRFSGKSVGKALLDKAEEYGRKNDVKMISLFTRKKADAFNFYKKRGYKEDKDVVFMIKKI